METRSSYRNWLSIAALLLVLPSAWFFCVNVLNEIGVSAPYFGSQPVFESLGIHESLGWNINLLIVGGPVLALLCCALQVLHIEWHFSAEQFKFNITIRKKWLPLFLVFVSGLLLTILFIYLAGENCNC